MRVNWDDDINTLEGEEITVEIRERIPITTSISHNFVSIQLSNFLYLWNFQVNV